MSELSVDTLSGSTGTTVTVKTGHTLTLVANMDAGTAKITNLGDPTSAQDAATKTYVDTQLLTLDTLGELTDVTITSVADNEVLAYDTSSGEWINQTASEAGLATSGNLTTHTSDTANPHGVTAAQAGATTTSNKITDFTAPTSDLDMNSNKITSVSDPTLAQDAATKAYVDAQVDTADDLGELSGTSDDVTEGTTNLYFTNERVDDRFNDLFQDGTGLTGTYDDGSNTYTLDFTGTTSDVSEGTNLYYTDARVQANRLDQMAAPTADVSMNSNKLTNLTDPTDAQDAVTKAYLENAGFADVGLILALGG